ncbi:MAG: L-threonylcarbamoyladenylate synthase [Myxococcota bacterium]
MRLVIDPNTPKWRQLKTAAEHLENGEAIAFPTDTTYALGASIKSKNAIEKLYELKRMSRKKPLSILCRDLSDISRYAVVSDYAYRTMKRLLPGPYTFILPATREVPRIMQDAARKTVGIRVPNCPLTLGLLEQLGHSIVATSAQPTGDIPLEDPIEIEERFGHGLALVIDSGIRAYSPSTVVNLIGGVPEILREGSGSIEAILSE